MYDIGIVGAGPAGATLARLLAGRCRILLLDSGRSKCCGGILAPEAQKMLAQFGLTVPESVLVHPQPRAVAVFDLHTQLVRRYERRYINVDRQAFDRWLLSLVPESVDVRHTAIYRSSSIAWDGKAVEIQFIQDGQMRVQRVRQLVGADGAFSLVRRQHFSERILPKRYVAIQHWFERDAFSLEGAPPETTVNFSEDYVGIFDAEITDFYAWSIPKNEYLVVGAAIPASENAREKFNLLQKKLRRQGIVLPRPIRREAGQLLRPLGLNAMNPGGNRIILLGEAAGLISPSSAEGVGAALASAWQLSRTYGREGFNTQAYRRSIRKLRWDLWSKIIKIPIMFNPWLRKAVMLSGLTAR